MIVHKSAWLAALRSGTYKQGHEHLETANGRFCCLGVYCQVLGIARLERKVEESRIVVEYNVPSVHGDWCDATTPYALGGLTQREMFELTTRNDRGDSFAKIANYIEANIEGEPE